MDTRPMGQCPTNARLPVEDDQTLYRITEPESGTRPQCVAFQRVTNPDGALLADIALDTYNEVRLWAVAGDDDSVHFLLASSLPSPPDDLATVLSQRVLATFGPCPAPTPRDATMAGRVRTVTGRLRLALSPKAAAASPVTDAAQRRYHLDASLRLAAVDGGAATRPPGGDDIGETYLFPNIQRWQRDSYKTASQNDARCILGSK